MSLRTCTHVQKGEERSRGHNSDPSSRERVHFTLQTEKHLLNRMSNEGQRKQGGGSRSGTARGFE